MQDCSSGNINKYVCSYGKWRKQELDGSCWTSSLRNHGGKCSTEACFSTTVPCVTLSRLHTLSKPGHLLCKMQAQKLTTDREHSISLACMRPSDWLPVPQSSNSTEEPGEPSRTSHTVFWGFGNSVLLHYHGRPGIHYKTQVALELVIEINLFSNETMAVNHHS